MKSGTIPGHGRWQATTRKFAMPVTWLAGLWTLLVLSGLQNAEGPWLVLISIGFVASVPALVHLFLGRFLGEEWAQALVLIFWSAFAALAISLPGNLYTPMVGFAILPIVAAVSFGGIQRVLEATFLTALIIIAIAISDVQGLLPRNAGFLQSIPVLELAGLVLSLIVAGAGLAAVLPIMDAQARLRDALFRKSPHLDFCVDATGVILSASDVGRAWSRAKTLGGLINCYAGTALAKAALQRALLEKQASSLVIPVGPLEKDHVLHIDRLDAYRAVISLVDVSEQRSRERSLTEERDVAVKATQDKTLFLASMSHELRTPLNAIIGFSDMMKARLFGPIPAKYAEYADLIHESGRHLVDLIGDVLDMSKIESEHYKLVEEPFNMNEVVRSCVKIMQMSAEEAGVRLVTELPEFTVSVDADRKAFRQILYNLLSNAIKFTPGGGQIETSIELDADQVILKVTDNGVGMSKEDAQRIGTPYQQAKSARQSDARGTGLGLSLVKALTEMHHGIFEVTSELGQGTTIRLVLPVLDASKMDQDKVKALDVRSHIRRAQQATSEIAAVAARLSS